MRTPWQWLLDYTGVTAEIKRLEKKVYHTEDTVRQRDGQISKLHKVYSDTLDARNAWSEIAEQSQRREQYYKGVYEKFCDGIPILIRYDRIHTAHGTCGMVSDSLGEFVKYKALETLFSG